MTYWLQGATVAGYRSTTVALLWYPAAKDLWSRRGLGTIDGTSLLCAWRAHPRPLRGIYHSTQQRGTTRTGRVLVYNTQWYILFCSRAWNSSKNLSITQGSYATVDSSGMCHLMPQQHLPEWTQEDERPFVHCGIWISNKGLDNTVPAIVNYIIKWQTIPWKALWQTLLDVMAWFRPELPVCKCLLILLSPLWQMPLWHQVGHATIILSGIFSLYILITLSSTSKPGFPLITHLPLIYSNDHDWLYLGSVLRTSLSLPGSSWCFELRPSIWSMKSVSSVKYCSSQGLEMDLGYIPLTQPSIIPFYHNGWPQDGQNSSLIAYPLKHIVCVKHTGSSSVICLSNRFDFFQWTVIVLWQLVAAFEYASLGMYIMSSVSRCMGLCYLS